MPAAEVLADELHLLRLFCQIADYEVIGGLGNERALQAQEVASAAGAVTVQPSCPT